MSAASGVRQHSARDLQVYGRRYGIDYRVPALVSREEQAVIRGRVQEVSLGDGMDLVASDVEVLHRYDSLSRVPSPLSIVVMLEGHADVSLKDRTLTLTPGMALSIRLDARHGLGASQPPGQRLRALTLGLNETRLAGLGPSLPSNGGSRMDAWWPPNCLLQGLEQALASPLHTPAKKLLLEGLGLQLLAHGLPQETHESAETATRLPPRERQRLERVRSALEEAPDNEHRLDALADLAAMSPASLRRKFRTAFGCSVFDYLRDCRLRLAHDYLIRGFSVQQTAHFCGYRHASNFATAFRRRYGMPPSSLTNAS